MQEFKVKRTGRPEFVFHGTLLFSIKIESVKYELYITVTKEYVLACKYRIFNIDYLHKVLSFKSIEDLNDYSISNSHFEVIGFMLKNGFAYN